MSIQEGMLIGIANGAVEGWVVPLTESGELQIEAMVDGEEPFAATAPTIRKGARHHFSIDIPERLRDGRIRFLDARVKGASENLPGGPLLYDGGLFEQIEPCVDAVAPEDPVLTDVQGAVTRSKRGVIAGWAWSPSMPHLAPVVELLVDGELRTTVHADQTADIPEDVSGLGRCFSVELGELPPGRREIVVRARGMTEPLDGGRFTVDGASKDGEVPCAGYLDDGPSRDRIARLPLGHVAFNAARMAPKRFAARLLNRLRRERISFDRDGPRAPVALMMLGEPDEASRTVWNLQSYPSTTLLAGLGDPAAIRAEAARHGHVLFAWPGDILHPSVAGIVARQGSSADAIIWARFVADEARLGVSGTVHARPDPDPITLRHGALADTTLAVRGEVLARAPDGVLTALAAGRVFPLMFWMAGQPLSWRLHPEALTSSVGPFKPGPMIDPRLDEPLLSAMLREEGERHVLVACAANEAFPFVLLPARRALKVSVVVCYRDKAALTLKCVQSLSEQRLTGELEVVLVDNQSTPEEARRVTQGAREILGEERVVEVAYDRPFNHSAQNNMGAAAASGEVVVICNNDITLSDPTLLEQAAAWALEDGVGTVGVRLENPETGRGSYGHRFTAPSEDQFHALLRENDDPHYSRFVHACPGNTLAFAAMAKDRFQAVGGLNEVEFPIGYNDMEFVLRCRAHGLRHVYLGHVHGEHRRGSSRTGDNEDLQAMTVRHLYPAEAVGFFRQLALRVAPPIPRLGGPRSIERSAADAAVLTAQAAEDRAAACEALAEARAARLAVEEQRLAAASDIRSLFDIVPA